ncbi:carbohydrate ABC transporter ATP-binding protein (CUT1 family) [Microterricola gilva]|uniref:Carbohydrate ABC transporter ATP-binding protein (CUT1 family) n=1 Tax=Microterricola gilva TaxID=393267 RepID=A0A4Q8AND4_9MICO|nr:ABC transporter ATP-binding protein [Microterricola gilva]RZU66097.1 carbohydrate ABC transporter ATP-binding protein (CUT1 family) [Microterricola gilva]
MGTIQIDNLSREFAKTAAVDSVTLTVDDGDFLVLLGPSGCGKTTLLRMIAGLLEPTSGRLLLDGRDITAEPSKKRDLAMVFQSYALYPHLSVARNLGFPLRVAGVDKAAIRERVSEVARMLEIDHLLQRKPKELSGGQRQRVAVGRALVRNPRAFLMDEPLSNLDAKLRTATRHELTSLHRRLGATFVYVTHDQVEAMTMATKIAVLNKGRLEQVGTPEEVYDRPASVFVAGFLGSPAMNLRNVDVTATSGMVRLGAVGLDAVLWEGDVAPFEAVLGVRPEHLTPVAPAAAVTAATGLTITGTVDIIENLGSEEIVYVRVGEDRVAARVPRTGAVAAGSEIVLRAAVEHVHLFDAVTGRRLEWRADAAPAQGGTALPADALATV